MRKLYKSLISFSLMVAALTGNPSCVFDGKGTVDID